MRYVAFAFLFLVMGIADARAEKVLFFSPTRIELSDRDKVATINVTNLSEIARAYNITAEDFMMTPEGVTRPVETFDYSAKRMIRFVPKSFELQPGQSQTVRVMARYRPDTQDGQYHSHLRFLENISKRAEINEERISGNGASMKAPLSYAAAIPVILTKGTVETTVGMKDVKLKKTSGGRYSVTMKLTREGNGQGTALIDTEYFSPSGETIKATVRRTIHIYRELSERKYEYDFEMPDGVSVKAGGKIKIKLFNDSGSGGKFVREEVFEIPL